MISSTADTKDTIEALNNQQSNQYGRINSTGSGRSLLSMNLNFLGSGDDVALDGGLQSSEVVKDILLPDTNDVIEDEEQPIKLYDGKSPAHDDDELCPSIAKLTSKLERISTGESIIAAEPVLNEKYQQLSSKEWINDFKDDTDDMGTMHQSLFMESGNITIQAVQADKKEYQIPLTIEPLPHDQIPSLPDPDIVNNITTTIGYTDDASSIRTNGSSTIRTADSKKKTKKKRHEYVLDYTRAIQPTDGDVLFGKGGKTNNHPGNIRYRAKALELRGWYEQSTKEEKYNISTILMESVKSEGNRFLMKEESNGNYYEVLVGARWKCSAQLREKLKGVKKSGSIAA